MKRTPKIQVKKNKTGEKVIICNLEKMDLKVYNEWGERVYFSSSMPAGGIALLIAK